MTLIISGFDPAADIQRKEETETSLTEAELSGTQPGLAKAWAEFGLK